MHDKFLDVVVADDNPMLLGVLSEIFREGGHKVRTASDGFTALAQITKRLPDILLSDLCMPGMSGYELLSVVRRRFPSVRVIAMSGSYSGHYVPPGIAADAFYAKGSCSVAQLVQLVEAVYQDQTGLLRSPAPVWVSEVTAGSDRSVVWFSCPECLRPFSYPHDHSDRSTRRPRCIHCRNIFDLALVREAAEVDKTSFARTANCQLAKTGTCSESTPVGGMHQP